MMMPSNISPRNAKAKRKTAFMSSVPASAQRYTPNSTKFTISFTP